LHLGLSVDAISGLVLTIDELSAEDAKTLKAWMEPIASSVGAEVLVSDDADGSLLACGVTPAQAEADLVRLGELIVSRQPKEACQLEHLHRRYLQAAPPSRRRTSVSGLSLTPLVSGSLELVDPADALPQVE
jgi:hypothetical protein